MHRHCLRQCEVAALMSNLCERSENRDEIDRLVSKGQYSIDRVVASVEELRQAQRRRFKGIDSIVHEDGRVVAIEPIFNPFVVVLEVISKGAIKKQIVVLNTEKFPQLLPSRDVTLLVGPENLRHVSPCD